MAPTVALEKSVVGMTGKSHRISSSSKRFPSSAFLPDYCHATAESVKGESSSGRVDSEGSCSPKRKCMSLKYHGMDVPLRVIAVSKLSKSEKKELELRLMAELEQIRILQKKLVLSVTNNINRKKSATGTKKGRFQSKRQPAVLPIGGVTDSNAALMKQCEVLLSNLRKHRYAKGFNVPVDAVALNIPDYHTVIKHPMDLGTVKNKLAAGAYSDPWGFVADVRLTFTNAMTYNPPNDDYHVRAVKMSNFFEAKWKPVEMELAAAKVVKKRKLSPVNHVVTEMVKKPRVSAEDKVRLSSRLESMLEDLPEQIIDFLKRQSKNENEGSEDEIEVDIDALSDDTLLELQKLVDEYLPVKQTGQEPKGENSGVSSLSMHPCKVNEPADEDVDIGGNDPPLSSYPPMEIEKDATTHRNSKGSSSGSSGSDSDSSSSGSDSGSSSGNDTDEGASPANVPKGKAETAQDQTLNINRSMSGLGQSEQDPHPKPMSVEVDNHQDGENAPSERHVSPQKLYRAALLRSRFADTIIKAREKTLDQGEKAEPQKLRREREELERQKRKEKARLQAEAKAAEAARRLAEAKAAAEAVAEAKRKREIEREAARQALLMMEKTVEINENSLILKDLEMLGTVRGEHVPSSIDELNLDLSHGGMGGLMFSGCNPLERLGLYMKEDDEEEEIVPKVVSAEDCEGEID